MHENEIHTILLKYIDHEIISEPEEQKILRWIGQSDENRKYFEMLRQISGEKRYIAQWKNIDLHKNFLRFRDNVDQFNASSKKKPVRNVVRRLHYFTRIAAALLIFLLGAVSFYLVKMERSNYVQQVCAAHEQTKIMLSDGSMIQLNKGSQITYPEKLQLLRREVKLKGEAYFEIAKQKYSPFYINLENTTVKVLGTSFNIKELENGEVQVNVLSGKVSFFEKSNPGNIILLEAGEQGVFSPVSRKFIHSTNQSKNFLYWKTGKLSFVEQLLSDVFDDLELYFSIDIVVKDPQILENRFTSECDGDQLDDILNELALLYSLEYHKQGDTIFIQKEP